MASSSAEIHIRHPRMQLEEKLKDASVEELDFEKVNDTDSTDSLHDALDETIWQGDISKMDNSPYPEVRMSVPTTDDPSINLNHWRMWGLVTLFVIVFAGVNQFFSLRFPSLNINYLVAQLLCYPLGKGLAKLPHWDCRYKFFAHPGPFSKKEHACITISVALTSTTAYAMNILIVQTNFFNMKVHFAYQILLVWSSQMVGYGLAGLTRRWIIEPASCIWPQTLISISLFEALHSRKQDSAHAINGWRMSRYKLFVITFCISFVWYWFPGFIFKGLSSFNVILWGPATRNNFKLNSIFGISTGLGFLPITFDYTQVSQAMVGSVFATPFWVAANTWAAVLVFFMLILPILYYKNVWYSQYMPLISGLTFDNTQKIYNASRIMDDKFEISYQKYKAYSPIFIPFSFLLSSALNFASITALFVHSLIYYSNDIFSVFTNKHKESRQDIHMRLYSRYKECPNWWYVLTFAFFLGLSFLTVAHWKEAGIPVWGLVVSLLISTVMYIPQGILEAITNQNVNLTTLSSLICGYMLPMKPNANMMFKMFGYIPVRHGLNYSRDLKMAIYMKVPPRFIFWTQMYASLLSGVVNVLVQQWMRSHIKDLCDLNQDAGFKCAQGRTFYNEAIFWSLPKYLFSHGRIYYPILFFFVIGAVAPIVVFGFQKAFPKIQWLKHINTPVFFSGSNSIPPSTPYTFTLFFVVSFALSKLKQKWPQWHGKYNFALGAGIEVGVAVAVVVIFLCVQYPGGKLHWWGNQVYLEALDFQVPQPHYKTLAKGKTFGYKKWW